MIKNVVQFEHKVENRAYQLLVPADSPAGEVYDALCKFKAHILAILQAQQQANAQPEKSKEGVPA